MPSAWIDRTFEQQLRSPSAGLRLFPVWLLLGPRQVGKSSLLTHCGPERQYISLDDLATRARANADPALFARELSTAPRKFATVSVVEAPGMRGAPTK